jgi:CHAD domain-containing protein
MADIAKDAKISPEASVLTGLSRVSVYLWRQAWKHAEGTVNGDADELHDMRVAIRRLRSVLQNFEGEKNDPLLSKNLQCELREQRMRLGRLGDALGAVRDHDVLDGYLRSYAKQRLKIDLSNADSHPGLIAFERHLQDKRAAAFGPMVKRINKARRVGGLQESFGRWALGLPAAFGADYSLKKVAHRLYPMRVNEIFSVENALDDSNDEISHHNLRKALRRMRYTLETLGPCYDVGEIEIKERIKSLVALQDLLGEMQDRAVLHAKVLEAFDIKNKQQETEELPPDIVVFLRYGINRRRQLLGLARAMWQQQRMPESKIFVVG